MVGLVEKHVCPTMENQAQCHNLAEGLLPTLVQWFRSSTTPAGLCASAGVCGASLQDAPRLNQPALRLHDTAECAMCKYVVRQVKAAVSDAQTLERIKEVALQVCGSLPDELAASCTEFVDSYEPMIAELLETLDPDMVCGLLGVCVEALAAVPAPPLPVALVQALAGSKLLRKPPPPPFLAMVAMMGLPRGPHGPGGMMGPGGHHGGPGAEGPRGGMMSWMPPPLLFGGPANDACDYCKMAVIEAHSLVSNPSVQAEVVNYTKAVCDNFPSFAEPCKTYVDAYAPLVFTLLEQYLVPDTLCAQTGMCPPPPAPRDGPGPGPGGILGWLADSWLGDLMRTLGLGGFVPYRPEHDMHHPEQQQREAMVAAQ